MLDAEKKFDDPEFTADTENSLASTEELVKAAKILLDPDVKLPGFVALIVSPPSSPRGYQANNLLGIVRYGSEPVITRGVPEL